MSSFFMSTCRGIGTEKIEPCFPRESGKNERMQLGKRWVEEKGKIGKEKKSENSLEGSEVDTSRNKNQGRHIYRHQIQLNDVHFQPNGFEVHTLYV